MFAILVSDRKIFGTIFEEYNEISWRLILKLRFAY